MSTKQYTIPEVFEMLGEDALRIQNKTQVNKENITVEGFNVYRHSLRYATFYQKGVTCACCGRVGTHFRLEADRNGDAADTRRHFNLYADDGVLMTKDHIRPRKWGGKDELSNLQTMCEPCNKAKGSQYDAEIDVFIGYRACDGKEVVCMTLEDAIFSMCEHNGVLSRNPRPGKLAKTVISLACKIHRILDTDETYAGWTWKTGKRRMKGVPHDGTQPKNN